MTQKQGTICDSRPAYKKGDQRPDGMYFWGRRDKNLLTEIWLTGPAFRNANGGEFPDRNGRLRYDGKRLYGGDWVSQEVFDRLTELRKSKPPVVGKFYRSRGQVFMGYRNVESGEREEVWLSTEAWKTRKAAERAAKKARAKAKKVRVREKAKKEARKPVSCGDFVQPGLIFVGDFSSSASKHPTRVYFCCSQWKAALEGQDPPPPELRGPRLRAYWWLVAKLRKQK
jgi:hypothetical protein